MWYKLEITQYSFDHLEMKNNYANLISDVFKLCVLREKMFSYLSENKIYLISIFYFVSLYKSQKTTKFKKSP